MLQNILLVILVLDCIALVAVILLQQSEGGALGMGGGPTGMFTARGAGDLLTRTTQILAGVFFVLALVITLLGSWSQRTSSVVDRLKLDTLSPMALPAASGAPATAPAASSAAPPLPGTAPAPTAAPPLPSTAPAPTVAPPLPGTAAPAAAPALRPTPSRASRSARPAAARTPAQTGPVAPGVGDITVAPPPVRAPRPSLNDTPASSQ